MGFGVHTASSPVQCCSTPGEPVVQADLHQSCHGACGRSPCDVNDADEPRPAVDQRAIGEVNSAVQQQAHDGTLQASNTAEHSTAHMARQGLEQRFVRKPQVLTGFHVTTTCTVSSQWKGPNDYKVITRSQSS